MIPPKVYKFAPIDGVRYLLEESTLRFSAPSQLNDVNEVVPNAGRLLDQQMRTSARQVYRSRANLLKELEDATLDEFTTILYRHPTLGPVTRGASLRLAWQTSQRKFSRFGVLSVAASKDNLLMWAHYCSGQTGATSGICIGLKSSASIFHESEYPGSGLRGLQQVRYSEQRASFGAGILEERLAEILLTKSLDWQYEREWRCMRELPPIEVHMLVNFAAEDVLEIILAPNMPIAEAKQCLWLRTERYPHAELLVAMPHPAEFRMMFIECPTSEALLEQMWRDLPDTVTPLELPRMYSYEEPEFEQEPPRLTFDELRQFEPVFKGTVVEPEAMGDWGAWLEEYSGAIGDILAEPLGDVMPIAELMAEDYLAECRRMGYYNPSDLVDMGDPTVAASEYEAEVAEEFGSFLRRWHAALHPRHLQ